MNDPYRLPRSRISFKDGYAAPEGSASVRLSIAGQSDIDQAIALLSGVEGGIEKAMRDAMRRAAAHLRKSSSAAIRERYAISSGAIRDESDKNIPWKVTYTPGKGVQADVYFAGERIPLFRFDGASPSQPTPDTSEFFPVSIGGAPPGKDQPHRMMHPGVAAYAHVLKSTSPKRFEGAFVVTVKAGRHGGTHTGIFERTGGRTSSGKDEIEELFGPAVPQMLASGEVRKRLTEEAAQVFMDRLYHNVTAILSGYWWW